MQYLQTKGLMVYMFEVFNLNVKIWVIVSVKNIGLHIKYFSNNLNDFTVH